MVLLHNRTHGEHPCYEEEYTGNQPAFIPSFRMIRGDEVWSKYSLRRKLGLRAMLIKRLGAPKIWEKATMIAPAARRAMSMKAQKPISRLEGILARYYSSVGTWRGGEAANETREVAIGTRGHTKSWMLRLERARYESTRY